MASRRGNNEGSITKRPDGRWEARITLDGGQRKSLYGKTRQEAAKRLAEALRDKAKGLPIVGEKQTLSQFAQTWLESAEGWVGPTSLSRYEQRLRLHILPTLGGIPLPKVSAQQLQALYAAKLASGLSTTTVRSLHTTVHGMLKDAVRLGLVQRNVADHVTPPRARHVEMMTYTPEQVRTFLTAAVGQRLEALFVLALSTGMRQGELLALKWSEVDTDTGFIQVRTTLKRIRGKLVIAETKTKRSRRRIALTLIACEALRRHRARLLEERLMLGREWHDCNLVFPNDFGRPIHLCGFNRDKFWPIIKKAGLPRIRFHDLRHTAATLLLLQGVHVKVVSEMLGHSSVSLTLDLYSHVLPDMQRDAARAMQRVLENG